MKITMRSELIQLTREQTEILDELMLVFSSATRYAFKRLLENTKAGPLEKDIAARYGLNIRQAKDAVKEAGQVVSSQKELLKLNIENLESKIAAIHMQLEKARSEKRKKALTAKLDKRQRKLNKLLKHQADNTIPTVIFGGRKMFLRRCKGLITKEEWQDCRNNRFYSRGDKTKGGNPNLRVVHEGDDSFLEVSTLKRTDSNRAVKVRMPLYLPVKRSKKTGKINGIPYKLMFQDFQATGGAYQVEVIRKKGRYYAHISFDYDEPVPVYTGHRGMIGIDTNPDGLALTMVDAHGNYVWHRYLKQHELTYCRSDRRINLCGELAAEAVRIAIENGCGIAIENLKFKKDRDVRTKFARISHQFVYAAMLSMLEQNAMRCGIEVMKVRPQYTSKIGLYKYCHQYGMDVHNGAAMVITRRSYQFRESVPKILKDRLIDEKELDRFNLYNEWKQWSVIHKKLIKQGKDVKNPGFYLAFRKKILGLIPSVSVA